MKPQKVFWSILYIYTLVGATLLLFNDFSFSSVYAIIVKAVFVLSYLLLLPSFLLVMAQKSKTHTMSIVVKIITLLAVLIGILLLSGYSQDAFGVHCTGIMGATVPCSESVLYVPMAIIFASQTFFSLPIALLVALAAGLVMETMARSHAEPAQIKPATKSKR